MKDLIDEILTSQEPASRQTEFMQIPDTDYGPVDTLGSRVLKVLKRTTLAPDAVLTVDEVIEAVGGRAPVVRQWLKSSVLPLRHPTGRVIYRWGDVLDAMRGAA